MKLLFTIEVTVSAPILVGQDTVNGRRQLIPINGGKLYGVDIFDQPMEGTVLPGGVDSQVIRPNGRCDLSARYAVRLDNGASFYIQNDGMRTVPEEYVPQVLQGEFIDPSLYYFATTPKFEVYDDSLRWLENKVLVCKAVRKPDTVQIMYYLVE